MSLGDENFIKLNQSINKNNTLELIMGFNFQHIPI